MHDRIEHVRDLYWINLSNETGLCVCDFTTGCISCLSHVQPTEREYDIHSKISGYIVLCRRVHRQDIWDARKVQRISDLLRGVEEWILILNDSGLPMVRVLGVLVLLHVLTSVRG